MSGSHYPRRPGDAPRATPEAVIVWAVMGLALWVASIDALFSVLPAR